MGFSINFVRRPFLLWACICWLSYRPVAFGGQAAGALAASQTIPAFELVTNDCVVFIGGRSTVADAKYGYLEALLTRRYPGKNIRFRNLGWEGDRVFRQDRPMNFGGLIENVKEQGATVLFISFGALESLQPDTSLADFIQAYGLLLDGLSEVTPRMVLLSPMRFGSNEPLHADLSKQNQNLGLYVAAIRDLAQERGLFFVDLFKLTNRKESSGEGAVLTVNGMHPSAYGYWRAGYEIERSLALPQQEGLIEIDTISKKYMAPGTQLSGLEIVASGIRFRTVDAMLPGPSFREDESTLSLWKGRVLKVTGLAPGRYALKVDGQKLYEKSHIFWEQGWLLSHSPEMDQAEQLRELIVSKNQDFFNYWRPQNWAFLNGDLIDQPSSHRHDDFKMRWFPDEMKGFLPLISRKETRINKLSMPLLHIYELSRVE